MRHSAEPTRWTARRVTRDHKEVGDAQAADEGLERQQRTRLMPWRLRKEQPRGAWVGGAEGQGLRARTHMPSKLEHMEPQQGKSRYRHTDQRAPGN